MRCADILGIMSKLKMRIFLRCILEELKSLRNSFSSKKLAGSILRVGLLEKRIRKSNATAKIMFFLKRQLLLVRGQSRLRNRFKRALWILILATDLITLIRILDQDSTTRKRSLSIIKRPSFRGLKNN